MLTLFTTGLKLLIKAICLFFFFSSLVWSAPYTKLAQDESSIFDESDLADIEGDDSNEIEDDLLEQEFDNLEEDESTNNFDPKDFELLDEDEGMESDESETFKEEKNLETLDGANKEDYEIISDKEGYEIITDEELEAEFEGDESLLDNSKESKESEEDLESLSDEDLDDFGSRDEGSMESDTDSPIEDLPEDQPFIDEPSILEEDTEDPMDQVNEDPVEDSMDEDLMEEPDSFEIQEEDADFIQEPAPMNETEESVETFDEYEEDFTQSVEETSDLSLNLVTNIRYITERDQIVISAEEPPSYEERFNEETNQIIIEILQSKLGENLHWPYILRDFKTDFGLVKADQKNKTTVRVIVQLKEGADIPPVTLSQEGDIIIGVGKIESAASEEFMETEQGRNVLPAKTLEDLYYGDIEFSGSPMSFHVIDADIKQVLRFISEESGLNMVIDETVSGTVTLKLEDVPWDQALYTLFKVKSLGYTRDGNVITILPLIKIEERTKKLKEISERQKIIAPFETKVIPIMYLKAGEIEGKIKEFLTKPAEGLEGGRILVNESSNALVVIDNKESIKKIEAMIQFLDKAPQQVMVESKIVEVSKTFSRSFGLNWNLSGDLPVNISASGVLDFFQSVFDTVSGSWRTEKGTTNVINVSGLPFIGDIGATLNLAEADGTARVLNTTKIFVRSGQSASIEKNTPIQIRSSETQNLQQSVQNEGNVTSTFESLDIKLSSTVTPTVTSSGSIAVDVQINLSDPGPGGGEGQPLAITRTAQTEVLAKNGQTIVVSGIYQKNENQTRSGMPFLRKIPLVKFLFDDRSILKAESEMLMFVTPTLVEN